MFSVAATGFSLAREEFAKRWDVAAGIAVKTMAAQSLFSVAFAPGGKTLASHGADTVQLWDLASGKELWARERANLEKLAAQIVEKVESLVKSAR